MRFEDVCKGLHALLGQSFFSGRLKGQAQFTNKSDVHIVTSFDRSVGVEGTTSSVSLCHKCPLTGAVVSLSTGTSNHVTCSVSKDNVGVKGVTAVLSGVHKGSKHPDALALLLDYSREHTTMYANAQYERAGDLSSTLGLGVEQGPLALCMESSVDARVMRFKDYKMAVRYDLSEVGTSFSVMLTDRFRFGSLGVVQRIPSQSLTLAAQGTFDVRSKNVSGSGGVEYKLSPQVAVKAKVEKTSVLLAHAATSITLIPGMKFGVGVEVNVRKPSAWNYGAALEFE